MDAGNDQVGSEQERPRGGSDPRGVVADPHLARRRTPACGNLEPRAQAIDDGELVAHHRLPGRARTDAIACHRPCLPRRLTTCPLPATIDGRARSVLTPPASEPACTANPE